MFSSNFLGGGGSIRLDFVMVINNQNDDGCVPVYFSLYLNKMR